MFLISFFTFCRVRSNMCRYTNSHWMWGDKTSVFMEFIFFLVSGPATRYVFVLSNPPPSIRINCSRPQSPAPSRIRPPIRRPWSESLPPSAALVHDLCSHLVHPGSLRPHSRARASLRRDQRGPVSGLGPLVSAGRPCPQDSVRGHRPGWAERTVQLPAPGPVGSGPLQRAPWFRGRARGAAVRALPPRGLVDAEPLRAPSAPAAPSRVYPRGGNSRTVSESGRLVVPAVHKNCRGAVEFRN